MAYIIKTQTTNAIHLADDLKSVSLDVTVTYNREGESKLPDGSTGTTVVLSIEAGERDTLVPELNEKVHQWFNEQYNPLK